MVLMNSQISPPVITSEHSIDKSSSQNNIMANVLQIP